MKRIFLLLIVALSFILSGCGGSGGDADGNNPAPSSKVSTNIISFSSTGNRFHSSINITATEIAKSTQIELKNFSINLLNDCTISSYIFNGASDISLLFKAVGETHNVSIDGSFECKNSSQLQATDVQITYDKWLINSNGSKKRGPFHEAVNLGQNTNIGGVTYSLYPDEELYVYNSNTNYPINVGVSITDENGTHPAVGVTVNADFIQPIFGALESYSIKTNQSGIATFNYISPKNIQNISESSKIYFYINGTSNLKKSTKLIFNPQFEDIASKLYIIPSNIQVTTPGEEQNITIVTVNSNNIGVSSTIQFEQLTNGDGNNYGKLSATKITTDSNGIGNIVYTAPDDINNQPSRTISATVVNSNLEKDLTFTYISPEGGRTLYDISVDIGTTVSVDSNTSLAIKIHEKGNPNKLIDNENIENVTLSIKNYEKMLAFTELPNSSTYSYSAEAVKSIGLTTKTIAGVAIVEIEATVFDGKEDVKISKIVPVDIISGPVSSISLNYIATVADEATGLFHDIYNIHAIDRYANPARAGRKFHPTLICGGSWSHPKSAGTILPLDDERGTGYIKREDNDYTLFADPGRKPFDVVDIPRDRLIVLPSVRASKKDYIGGWTIRSVESNEQMILEEKYFGNFENGVKYIIGDEDRLLNNEVHVAHVKSSNSNNDYIIDENGTAKIEVIYDPAFVGHTYSLAVTSYGENDRTGTAITTSFRGNGYNSEDTIYMVPNHQCIEKRFLISINTPNGSNEWLDDVYLATSGFTITPSQLCDIDFKNSNLHVENGSVTLNICANSEGQDTKVECKVTWVNNHSGIYYEY